MTPFFHVEHLGDFAFHQLNHSWVSQVPNLDRLSPSEQLVRRLKLSDNPLEVRRQWHIVVDTNCLLDADSLKALKQVEGIREVHLIIPKIGT